MSGPFAPFVASLADEGCEHLRAALAADADIAGWAEAGVVRKAIPVPAVRGVAGGLIWVGIDARAYVQDPGQCPEGSIPVIVGIQWVDSGDLLEADQASVDALVARIVEIAYANETLGGRAKRLREVRPVGYDQTNSVGGDSAYHLLVGIEYRYEASSTGVIG